MPYKPNKPFRPSPRELIVVARPEARLRVTDAGVVVSQANFDVKFLNELLRKPERRLRSLFQPGKKLPKYRDRDDGRRPKGDVAPPDLSVYFHLSAPDGELESLARQLYGHPAIDAAYVKPGAVPPVWHTCDIKEAEPPELYGRVNASGDVIAGASGGLSEFTQRYLGDPPKGIGARYVWENFPGARGEDVKIIDIEGDWSFTHEDLQENQGGLVGGTLINDPDWRKHGTAVLGILGGDENDFGITGICPEAFLEAVSNTDTGVIRDAWVTATAIQHAADRLSAGDIILIELQLPGPAVNFEHNSGQAGYIPVEWWDDNLRAIQYATNNGVIVVEAGANGGEDLDDVIYDDGPFGDLWRNPFRRAPIDSGAIIVGAGAPPEGTHGRTSQRDRSRLTFSNYGSMFDAQGWGTQVETCGGASEIRLGGANQDLLYTKFFSGTSSAAAMVAGALGCIQGARKCAGLSPLTPQEARELLRCNWLGSPQEMVSGSGPDVSKRIGSRPNLIKMITVVV